MMLEHILLLAEKVKIKMTNNLTILIVDDEPENFESVVTRINHSDSTNQVNLVIARDITQAESKIAETPNIDIAVIDMKLGSSGQEGNEVIDNIQEKILRIPCICFSATPSLAQEGAFIESFTKGDIGADDDFEKVIEYAKKVYKTGITKILGGRGSIEDYLYEIYKKNIEPNLEEWFTHTEAPSIVERALLRHIGYCLEDKINVDIETSLNSEIYILPHIGENIRTGTILKKDSEYYIVTSPECDLVVRGSGLPKSDVVQICKIENFKDIFQLSVRETECKFIKQCKEHYGVNTHEDNKVKAIIRNTSSFLDAYTELLNDNSLILPSKSKKIVEDRLSCFFNNNAALYYHFLPKHTSFIGGIINFRKIYSFDRANIADYSIICKVASPYSKEILNRFASYYARQGQPDFNKKQLQKQIFP